MLCFHYCHTFFLARQNDAPVTKIKICSICGASSGMYTVQHANMCYGVVKVSSIHIYRVGDSEVDSSELVWGGGLCDVNRLVIVRHQWSSEKSQEGGPDAV